MPSYTSAHLEDNCQQGVLAFATRCSQVTEDMARRAAANDYESDVEEEQQEQEERTAAAEAAAEGCSEEAAAALKVLAEAEKKLKELHEQEVRLKVRAGSRGCRQGHEGRQSRLLAGVGAVQHTHTQNVAGGTLCCCLLLVLHSRLFGLSRRSG